MAGENPGSDLTVPSTIGWGCQKAQKLGGGGRTAMARGVPLEAEPGYACYLKGVG